MRKRDQEKYGNPNGPTFEYLLKKNKDLDFSTNEAYQNIIESASQVNKVYIYECKN